MKYGGVVVEHGGDVEKVTEYIKRVIDEFEIDYMPANFVQIEGRFNHMVCCRKFEYNAAALREAFVKTGQSAVVYEQEVYDLDTFNPSFNLEAEIMHLERQLANLKYPNFEIPKFRSLTASGGLV